MLDLLAGGGALIAGVSLTLVACTLLGLAVWGALVARPSGIAVVLARWTVGGAGTVALGLGAVLVGAAFESTLGRPLGAYSGAISVIAWWLAFRVGAWDAALTAALASRLASRTGSPLATALQGWSTAVSAGAALCSMLAAGAGALIAIAMVADALF